MAMNHEITLHGDERVFYSSASSVFKDDYSFVSLKDYPGGAFVFQMPFQFVGKVISAKFPNSLSERQWGRLASIFYFSAACLMGGVILWRNFGKRPLAVLFYALIMVFGLLQIEQSRYGTGDAISFFVLMVILYAIDIYFREEDNFYLYFAALFTGAIAAVKFPLIFFIIYPICALVIAARKRGSNILILKPLCGTFIFALLGLLLFSPQWFIDKAFFMKAFFIELNPYFLGAAFTGDDTMWNNFTYVVLYQLFYSDFPLALPLFVWGIVSLYRQNKEQGFTNAFYTLVLPVSMFLFFSYNLLATLVTFRTYYPYYCLCIFYTSFALSELFGKGKRWRIAIIALSVFMVVRGGFFVYALTKDSRGQYIVDTLVQHAEWDDRKMTIIYGYNYIPQWGDIPQRKYLYDRFDFLYGEPQLRPGEFGVTGAIEYAFSGISIFPSQTLKEKLRSGWLAFREQNKDYLIGVSYPRYYHYIFGGWLPGSSLAYWEFPVNYIYYRGHETGSDTQSLQKYRPLYEMGDWREWLEAIAQLDCTIIASVSGELPEDFFQEVRAILSREFAEGDTITINDRTYTTGADGFIIVVYDNEREDVVDWRSLTIDAESGEISFDY
jgi:hypothetical protein